MATILRTAELVDAEAVARLHADSWRRHYRGAYSDSYLDGDIVADRLAEWSTRLASPVGTTTILAVDDARLLGFAHVVFDDDARWGSLLDNLHVTHDRQRSGLGTTLIASAARSVLKHGNGKSMYLWVQEQNVAAQQFYERMRGTRCDAAPISPPGGVLSRLTGEPQMLRIAWADASTLTSATKR